jgi:predicted porin
MNDNTINARVNPRPNYLGTCIAALAIGLPTLTQASELKVEPYGSLRTQVEAVSADNVAVGEDDSYVALRDAYSRFGVNASYDLENGTVLGAKIEVPFNTQNFNAEDPTYFDDQSIRVGKITAAGDWGSMMIGKGWLPYYNNIAYPVDMFSSFYSGWATYAMFREYAVSYTTPSLSGLKLTAAAIELDPSGDRGAQYVASYSRDGYTIAYGYEDMEDDMNDTHGLTLSYRDGPFYAAVKAEEMKPASGEKQRIYNLYASYDYEDYTFKGMVAEGDDGHWAPGFSTQFGVDYRYNDALTLFAEYFMEEKSYAILKKKPDSYDPLVSYAQDSDGQAFLVGVRYDF